MTDRLSVNQINSDQLDQLYDRAEQAEALANHLQRNIDGCTADRWPERLAQAETERDGAYRERAHLVAWLAALHSAVIAPAPDIDEPGWQILYLRSSAYGWQMTWHIHPRDAELFTDVEHVPADDPRAEWDGHSTEQKYNRMRTHVRVVHMNNRLGATSCPVCEGTGRCPSCRTTMRAAEDPHVYLSTGCYHDDHAYCQAMTGLNGAKRPGECKKCGARCICPCHTDQPKEQ